VGGGVGGVGDWALVQITALRDELRKERQDVDIITTWIDFFQDLTGLMVGQLSCHLVDKGKPFHRFRLQPHNLPSASLMYKPLGAENQVKIKKKRRRKEPDVPMGRLRLPPLVPNPLSLPPHLFP
jgi:hypothetical protein